jgi:hypothetical protein
VYAILFLLATNDARDYNIRNSEKSSDDCHDKTYGFQSSMQVEKLKRLSFGQSRGLPPSSVWGGLRARAAAE